jgi:hypothetical protein
MLVGQVHSGIAVPEATGVSPGTAIGIGWVIGTAGGKGAHAVTARRVSSKIIEILIGMLLRLIPTKDAARFHLVPVSVMHCVAPDY